MEVQMSADSESTYEVCAGCGIAGLDDVKLKKCACDLVKYCGVACQKNHRPQHKKACKQRLAEAHDEILFMQPDGTHCGDCPICFLPLPLDDTKYTVSLCCSKMVCKGCVYANMMSDVREKIEPKCPFCRTRLLQSQAAFEMAEMKRAEANDPVPLCEFGARCRDKGDYDGALENWTKAARSGSVKGHACLGIMYAQGEGGVERDEKKAFHHLEKAAVGGDPKARFLLGCLEARKGNKERAVKHWIIAANQGQDEALNFVKEGFQDGIASKEEYASTLRRHQAAVDATISAQREEAYKFYEDFIPE
eukprot:scaffold29303_cov160-Skeletonema_menzelii.AAC.3